LIVADASAAVSALLNDGFARQTLSAESIHVPHLVDAEVANALRGIVVRGTIDAAAAAAAVQTWRRLGMRRYPVVGLLDRIWELRSNLSAYDASYVALAEAIGCALVTADVRLSHAPGLRCPVTAVPN
jgi:predicted nucleic acid-binding protein